MKNLYKSGVLLIAVTALVLLLIALDCYLFHENPLVFWVLFPVLLGFSGLAVGKLFQIRGNELWYFEQINDAICTADSMTLVSFPLPVAVVDANECIVWVNTCFEKSFFKLNEDNNHLDLLDDNPLELMGKREIEYNEQSYRVYAVKYDFDFSENKMALRIADGDKKTEKSRMTVLVFENITQTKQLKRQAELTKPVVMVLMVDNYEELLSGAKESERAKVTSEVDRLVEDYFSEKKAVLRKTSADKFLIVLEEQYLSEMIAQNAPIINMAHEIEVRERAVVTLSIGVGTTSSSLSESERFAEEMLEKALDRGGDQAIIKTKDGFKAIGAASPGRERSGKIKIRLAAEKIHSLIRTADTVYIMGHGYSDFDSAGSAIGLACAIRRLGKPAYAVAQTASGRTSAKALYDRFFDYEKLGYDNAVVVEPKEAKNFITEKSVLIIVDTHIAAKVDDPELLEMCAAERLVVIDHHRLSAGEITEYGVRCHESSASSAAELVTELVQYFSADKLLSALEAEALLAGIMLDTKDFVMRSGVATFEAAAYLKKLGADTISVKKLFDTTIESKARKAEIVSSARIYRSNCAIAVVSQPFSDIRVVCSQAADEMLYIKNVDASFTIYPIEGGWSCSARSFGKVNVQTIMESLGNTKSDGGGHQSMAGAQLYGITLEETVEKLENAIDEQFSAKNEQESDSK